MSRTNTQQKLEGVLLSVPPARLLALDLLHQQAPDGGWFPVGVDPEQATQATVELIDYTRACQSAQRRLASLGPVALEAPTPEFPL